MKVPYGINIGMDASFVAGSLTDENTVYRISLNLLRSLIDAAKACFLARFIEFWCHRQCVGGWRIEQDKHTLMVCFELPRDGVLFHFSDEFDYMQSRPFANLL